MIETLLQIGFSNIVVAGVLALIVASLTRIFRNPPLAHALWLVVLLKLVTPPLVAIPIDLPLPATPVAVASMEPIETLPVSKIQKTDLAGELPSEKQAEETDVASIATALPSSATPINWTFCLAVIWASGAVLLGSLVVLRAWRFFRLLRRVGTPSERIMSEVRHLAKAAGLRKPPRVVACNIPISPMVIGWRQGTLVIPESFVDSLSPTQRSTLLAHEIAHLRRGDHRLAWAEMIITCLYWWNPVVWIARRGLRRAADQCCDGLVLKWLPGTAPEYADTLMNTLDFLAEKGCPLPLAARGLGEMKTLRERFEMILKERVAYRLSRGRICLLVAISLVALALFPVFTSAEPDTPKSVSSNNTVDLRKHVKMLIKEPEYKSTPMYALLAFGKDMKQQSWLVVDGETVYIDRNANGDLTDKEDRVALNVEKTNQHTRMVAPGSQYVGSNIFDLGNIAGHSYWFDVWELDEDFVPPPDYPEILGRYRKERIANGWANASLFRRATVTSDQIPVCLCPRPKDAQISYIDGPRTFELENGRRKLERDKENVVSVRIGTQGAETKNNRSPVFASMPSWEVPDKAYPIAVFEFPSRFFGKRSIKKTFVLNQTGHHFDWFFASVKVPTNAADGDVKVTVSFPDWPEGNVAPRVFEIPLK